LTFGDQKMGSRLVNAARECTHSPVALQFFLHGISRLYKHSQRKTFRSELLKSQPQVVSQRVRKEVFLMLEHLRSLKEDLDWSAENTFVRNCLAPVASTAFSREEASYYVPRFGPHPELQSLGQAMVAEGLRRDPSDPQFRMFSELENLRSPLDLNFAKMESIYHDATRQGDQETARIAKTVMQLAESLDEFEEDDEDDDFGIPRDQIEEMRRMAAEMSDAEFEAFRQDSRKFMPLPFFDLVMGGKRKKSSSRSPSEQARKIQPKSDQPDLFSE
jgi:hypothetical protein